MTKSKTAPKKSTRIRKTVEKLSPGGRIPKDALGAVGINFGEFAGIFVRNPHDYEEAHGMDTVQFHKKIGDPAFRKVVAKWSVAPFRDMLKGAPKEVLDEVDNVELKTAEYLEDHYKKLSGRMSELGAGWKDLGNPDKVRKAVQRMTLEEQKAELKKYPLWIKVVAGIWSITEIGWKVIKVLVVAFFIAYGIHWYISLFTR